jgi:hypothetical protein
MDGREREEGRRKNKEEEETQGTLGESKYRKSKGGLSN